MTTDFLNQAADSWSIDIGDLIRRLDTGPKGLAFL